MTQDQQKLVTQDFLDSIREKMMQNIDKGKIPKNWAGFELRHLIHLIVEHEDYLSPAKVKHKPLMRKRKKDCENDALVNNLW